MKRNNGVSLTEWSAWGWLSIFLLLSISSNGIFQGLGIHNPNQIASYEKPLIYSFFLAIAILVWIGSHLYAKGFVVERRMVFGIASLVLALVYLLSSFKPESPMLAQFGVLTSLVIVVFFVAGIFLIQYERIISVFPRVYLIFGYIVVLYGLLNLLGNAYLLDSLLFNDGIRITSIFQYANAYAVLLLTLWVAVLIEMGRTTNKTALLIHGSMLVPICASFLLTLSRGALIVLPIVAIVTLIMFRVRQQILIIIYSLLGMALALSIYGYLEKEGTEVYQRIQETIKAQIPFDTISVFSESSIFGWVLIIGASLIMALMVYVVNRFVEPSMSSRLKKYTSKWANRWLPLTLTVIFVLVAIAISSDLVTQFLPEVLRTRVESINLQTHSVYERLTMYKDAIDIWEQHKVIGGGAGAWEALYDKYQSYPYISTQSHGYLTQLLIEVGIVGLAVYAGFILTVIIVFLRYYNKADEQERSTLLFYFVTPITILIHSFIDFEMSYLFYEALVFMCLGVMAGTQRKRVNVAWNTQLPQKAKWITSVVILALVIIIAIPSGKHLYSINQFENSQEAAKLNLSLEETVQPLEKGLSATSGHPLLLHQMILMNVRAYQQTNESRYLEKAALYMGELKNAEPHYRPSIELRYLIAVSMGDTLHATEILNEGMVNYPFEQTFYEEAIKNLSLQWELTGAHTNDKREWIQERINAVYNEMMRREQIIKDLPDTVILNRTFTISDKVRLPVGKINFHQGNYEQASSVLEAANKDDLSKAEEREAARYYLAALRKEGKDDAALYQRLIKVDPTADEQIVDLLALK